MNKPSNDAPNQVRLDAWVAGVGALQREMLEFVASRFEKDGEAIRGAIASDSLGDALAVQQRWVTETIADYVAETGKVASLISQQGSAFPQFGLAEAVAAEAVGVADAVGAAEAATEAAVETAKEVTADPTRAAKAEVAKPRATAD